MNNLQQERVTSVDCDIKLSMVETTVHLKDYNNYHQALKIDVLLLVAPKMGFLEQLHRGMICLSAGLLFLPVHHFTKNLFNIQYCDNIASVILAPRVDCGECTTVVIPIKW